MLHKVNLEEVSDGKKYDYRSLVRVGCEDCKGCSACCRDMGQSVALDPYDISRLTKGLNRSVQELVQQHILDFTVTEGVITPFLTMDGSRGCCSFLDENGRCSIHSFRPGVCRLFPLGRVYSAEGIFYILQVEECSYPNKRKVRVEDWLDVEHYPLYEKYLLEWHGFVVRLREKIAKAKHADLMGEWNTIQLHLFFLKPYVWKETEELPDGEDTSWDQEFFAQFQERMQMANRILFAEE